MRWDLFLSAPDAIRVSLAIAKLERHGLRKFALTGGLATEIQLIAVGRTPQQRRLNDVDVVVESFDSIPQSVADGFLLRHIHPKAAIGKTLLQLVDPDQALRIDVFRECGSTIVRSQWVHFETGTMRLVSIEDLAARAGRIAGDLEGGVAVPRKHAEDFLRLADVAHRDLVEAAWREHRKEGSPGTFEEAFTRIRDLAGSREHLLVVPEYNHDMGAACERCEGVGPFRLADVAMISSILGYVVPCRRK